MCRSIIRGVVLNLKSVFINGRNNSIIVHFQFGSSHFQIFNLFDPYVNGTY